MLKISPLTTRLSNGKHAPTLALCILLCFAALQPLAETPSQTLKYRILQEAAHDTQMFTQGLLVDGEFLVETGGGYGQSSIRRYHKASGEIVKAARFPAKIFAEGVALSDNSLFVLTWREGICYELDPQTLTQKDTHTFSGQGWGLTYDGQHLIMSDGSDQLTFRRTNDFGVVKRVTVKDGESSWANLNELEFAGGLVWANVWQDSRVLAIAPQSGRVQGILDLSELVRRNSRTPGHSVLNGIAYDEERQAYWITGKLWPNRYLIEIIWPPNSESGNPPESKPVVEPANDNHPGP